MTRVTDSAGVTCEYTPIEQLKPGDVVIIGWRSTVKRVEVDEPGRRARVTWERGGPPAGSTEFTDQWNPLGSPMPKEVTA